MICQYKQEKYMNILNYNNSNFILFKCMETLIIGCLAIIAITFVIKLICWFVFDVRQVDISPKKYHKINTILKWIIYISIILLCISICVGIAALFYYSIDVNEQIFQILERQLNK